MLAKGVIKKIVPWAEARTYFYWRLCRRLREEELIAEMPEVSREAALAKIHAMTPGGAAADDKKAHEALTTTGKTTGK